MVPKIRLHVLGWRGGTGGCCPRGPAASSSVWWLLVWGECTWWGSELQPYAGDGNGGTQACTVPLSTLGPAGDMLSPIGDTHGPIGDMLGPIRGTLGPIGVTLGAVGARSVPLGTHLVLSGTCSVPLMHTCLCISCSLQTSIARVLLSRLQLLRFAKYPAVIPTPPGDPQPSAASSHPPQGKEGAPPPHPAICPPSSLCQHWLECGLISGGMSPPALRGSLPAVISSAASCHCPSSPGEPRVWAALLLGDHSGGDIGGLGGGCYWSCHRPPTG